MKIIISFLICLEVVFFVFSASILSAQLPDTVGLHLYQENMRILGDDADDRSGGSLASGDINGDGYDDIIIGAHNADRPDHTNMGETYVIYGSASPHSIIDLAWGLEDVRILGEAGGDYSGKSLATGDVNGDGYSDIIIGAYGADTPGGSDAGKAYIIYGSLSLPSVIDLSNGDDDVRILGSDLDDRLGGLFIFCSDINGDGCDDLIVGAHRADPPNGVNAGETYIIYGSSSLSDTINIGNGEEDVCIMGDIGGDWSGFTMAGGDVNGDRYNDIIIGAYGADAQGGEDSGETYIIYGSDDLPDSIDLHKNEEDVRVLGDDIGDWSGYALAIGDINGDEYDDVIIGAYQADTPGGGDAGEVYIIYGSENLSDTIDLADGEENVRILGDDEDDYCGRALAVGDINGDGFDDLIVGAYGADPPGGKDAGETYLIYGSNVLPSTIDLNTGAEDVRILGDNANDWSGYFVASGNINGDSCDDLIVGAWFADPPGSEQAGETYVIFGHPAFLDSDTDGISDEQDNCPHYPNSDQLDADGDNVGDVCDNCWAVVNSDQTDSNGDCPAPPYDSDPKCGDECFTCLLGDINCDDAITPGDALCAFWRSILEDFPEECTCECAEEASDVNCDGNVTPGDALCVFWRSILGNWTNDCQCLLAKNASQGPLVNCVMVGSTTGVPGGMVSVPIVVENPKDIDAFSLQLTYPATLLEFQTISTTSATEDWTVLDGVVSDEGVLNIGGFHIEGLSSEESIEIADIIFSVQDKALGMGQFELSALTDDLVRATVKNGQITFKEIPSTYSLSQNYPNPFNPETEVEFGLPENAHVTMKVYNVLGQVVDELINTEMDAGYHTVRWNGENVASGVYFYRIMVGKYTATKRMLLLR